MTTKVEIFNMALALAHTGARLTTEDDDTPEAAECRLWYNQVVAEIHEAAFWPKTLRSETLAEITGDSDARGFEYRYALPTDCLRPRFLHNFAPFALGYDSALGEYLATNEQPATLFYTFLQPEPSKWTPGQVIATAHLLAMRIAPTITGREDIITYLAQRLFQVINEAQVAALTSEQWSMNFSRRPGYFAGYFYPVQPINVMAS